VGVFLHGNIAGSYTTNAPTAVANVDPLAELIGHDSAGTVTILERVADDSGEPFIVAPVIEAPVSEETAPQAQFEPEIVEEPAALEFVAEPVSPEPAPEAELAPPEAIAEPELPEPIEEPAPLEPVAELAPPEAPEEVEEAPEPPPPPEDTPPAPPVAQTPPPQPVASLPPSQGIDTVMAAFSSMSSAPTPAAPIESAPDPPPPPLPAPVQAVTPEPPLPAPISEPTNYAAIVTELLAIGTRFLGRDFESLAPVIGTCPHTPQGLREAIVAVRDANLPTQPPDRLRAAARAMQLYVADRVTGT
jgi:hypothetical protein